MLPTPAIAYLYTLNDDHHASSSEGQQSKEDSIQAQRSTSRGGTSSKAIQGFDGSSRRKSFRRSHQDMPEEYV